MVRTVGRKTILGLECLIQASDSGLWLITEVTDDSWRRAAVFGQAPLLDTAVAQARKAIKAQQTPVRVPFRDMCDAGARKLATGMHGGTRQIRVEGPAGVEYMDGYRARDTWSPDAPDEDVDAYFAAQERLRDAETTMRRLAERHGIKLRSLVEEARERRAEEG